MQLKSANQRRFNRIEAIEFLPTLSKNFYKFSIGQVPSLWSYEYMVSAYPNEFLVLSCIFLCSAFFFYKCRNKGKERAEDSWVLCQKHTRFSNTHIPSLLSFFSVRQAFYTSAYRNLHKQQKEIKTLVK